MGKVTVKALKKKGMTGEEMRCLMWGRESINTPIKVKGKPKDPLLDPQGPNLTGAFGEALTTALDVMTFTHEFDINASAQGLNLASNPKPKSPVPNSVALNNQINNVLTDSHAKTSNVSVFGTFNQLADAQGFDNFPKSLPATVTVVPSAPPLITPVMPQIEDPLKELVILSDSNHSNADYLKKLAVAAANLPTDAETVPVQKVESKNMKNLAGIFAGTETFVKKVEESVRKKYANLEPSDSEGLGDGPLLGKISRTRRAKSAHQRNSSAKSQLSDKRRLIQESDSSSTDTIVETKEEVSNGNLDYAEERLRSIKESIKENNAAHIRPANIDIALEAEQMFVLFQTFSNFRVFFLWFQVDSCIGNLKNSGTRRWR